MFAIMTYARTVITIECGLLLVVLDPKIDNNKITANDIINNNL